jgi:hypothetical protein
VPYVILSSDVTVMSFCNLFLKCSSQKDYVILATRTPPKEEQNDKVKQPRAKLDNLDEEWATEHASQVI